MPQMAKDVAWITAAGTEMQTENWTDLRHQLAGGSRLLFVLEP